MKKLTRERADFLKKLAAIALAAAALVCISLPSSIEMRFSNGPNAVSLRYYSYYVPIVWGYGNFAALLTGVLTPAALLLTALSLFFKRMATAASVVFCFDGLCSLLALIFSFGPTGYGIAAAACIIVGAAAMLTIRLPRAPQPQRL